MQGKTNACGSGGLGSGDLITMFRCTYSSAARSNVRCFYQRDYVSYDSSNYTFTVLKPFTCTLSIIGKGSRNGSGTEYSVQYTFTKNGSTLYSGSCTNTGNGMPSPETVSFAVGDTFRISGQHGVTVYLGEVGFCMEMA